MTEKPKTEKQDLVSFVDQCLDLVQWEIKDDTRSEPWFEEMRRKCRIYIKNNGTKFTSVDEIVDHLKKEALTTFPARLREEMIDRVGDILDNCGVR